MKFTVFMSLWPCTTNNLISNWPRTRKFSQLFKKTSGKTDAFHFSNHSYALVTLYVQFYALIGQNFKGEFMWKFKQYLEICLL